MYVYRAVCHRVVDGDTLILDVDLGMDIFHRIRVRLLGINTPEIHGVAKSSDEYKKGMAAKQFLQSMVEGKDLIIKTHKDSKGRYGRYLAEVFVEGVNINKKLLDDGYAIVPKYIRGERP